jgi:hypothetical protein
MMQTTDINSIIGQNYSRRLADGLKRIEKRYSRMDMAVRSRNVAVLFSLIASMTVGALVLMALDDHTPIKGAYSLTSYLKLDPVEDAVRNLTVPERYWDKVEIYYSHTTGGNAD